MKAPLPEPPADLSKTLVLLGRPVRTRLELHPEQASWTKSGNFMDTPHGRGKRFGLGSRQGKVWPRRGVSRAISWVPVFHLFFTGLQAMAPAVGPEKDPGESAFSAWSCSAGCKTISPSPLPTEKGEPAANTHGGKAN